ncbi:MAG: ATP-binding protein [Bacteroidota bacterium]
MNIRYTLFLGFLILIGIFFVNFFINKRLSDEVVRNSSYISRSETVIRNSNMLHKSMIDMQSGFRGYLLTGQESFLQSYTDGLKDVPRLSTEQWPLVNSEQQKKRLDSILILHGRWVRYAQSLITARKDTLPEANARYEELFEKKLKMEVGKKINDSIRLVFTDFDRHEYNLRQRRREALRASVSKTQDISVLLTIISVSIALVSSLYIIWMITSRIKKMVKLAGEISRGNFMQIADHKRDEFRELIESLNTMSGILDTNIKELTKKNKELDQFAYVVSHDLKAPLRGIDNITKWIEEDHAAELTPAVKQNMDLIKGRTKRLENMINGLLEYARIGRVKKDVQAVDVGVLLKELVEILVPRQFVVSIPPGMPVIVTEKLHMEQVFSNLISNAVKYHDKTNGHISITSKDVGDYYEFRISDDGPGIPREYHEKIFMIFQTLKERDAFESTGIGLAIVKKVIEEQKGTVRVESLAEEGGTTFVFTWPKRPI